MPKTKISEFSATPANNTDIDSINIAEGCAPSGINDAIRELMAQLKDFQTGAVGDSFNGPVGTSTAAAGAFTTLAASGAVTLSGGTANGVTYLNGSKVLTSGSALTFDGTDLTFQSAIKLLNSDGGGNKAVLSTHVYGGSGATGTLTLSSTYGNANQTRIKVGTGAAAVISFENDSVEKMRLTSTGLGIGTTSPRTTLDVNGNAYIAGGGQLQITGSAGSTGLQLIGQDAAESTIGTMGSQALVFRTVSTERARIDTSGNFMFNSGYGSVATAFGCRAWVNFNGTGTVAIRGSGNVSSITDNGVGDYTVNFTTSLTDTNYSFLGGAQANGVANGPMVDLFANGAAASARFRVFSQAAAVMDSPVCTFMAVR